MPDNVSVSISADTSKLRGDLALAEKALQGLRKELKLVADEAQRTGDRTNLDKMTKEVESAEAAYRSINRQLKASRAAHDDAAGAIDGHGKKLAELGERAGRVGESFKHLTDNIFPRFKEIVALSIAGAAAEFVKLGNDAAKATDELGDAADALGITSDKFQAMQLVAARAGAETDTVATGFARFAKMLGTAQESATGTSEAFTKLGISASDFPKTAAGNIRAYEAVAKKIADMGDGAEKATVAAEFFGRGWAKQIEILKDFSKNLAESEKIIKQFGLSVSKSEAEQSEAYLKAYNTFKFVFERIKTIVGNVLGTALVPFYERLTQLLGENRQELIAWAQTVAERVAPAVQDLATLLVEGTSGKFNTEGFRTLATVIDGLAFAANAAATAIRGLGAALDLVIVPINKVFGTDYTGTGVIITALILRWVGAFRALGAILGTVRAAGAWLFAGGLGSALARVIPWITSIGTALRVVMTAFAAIGAVVAGGLFWPVVLGIALVNAGIAIYAFRDKIRDGLGAALDWVSGKFQAFGSWISDTFGPIVGTVAEGFKTAWNATFEWLSGALATVTEKFTALGTWLSETFQSAVGTAATAFKDAWSATFDWLKGMLDQVMGWWDALIKKLDEAWQKTKEALGLGGPGGASPAPQAARAMAGGGYVRGPGSATSDSVLARLSNGEYVMRAAAVSRWGPRFMAALNGLRNPFDGFADGGMVRTRGVPRFAGGGLVAAGGGATVNLVFPGGSFALQADNAVVGSLTREARRAGMLQGGRRAGLLQ